MATPFNITEINGNNFVVYPDGRIYNNLNCTFALCPVEISIYGYRPTLPGTSILIALYGLCGLIQIALGFRYKTWGFMAAMLLGCIDEMIGYGGRIILWQNPWDNNGFLMQIVLITMGPVFFCAAIYVMICNIILYIDPQVARFNPRLIYWGFLSCDVTALILQAVGGAMSSSSNGASQNGVNIALAGLAFQVSTLSVFCIVISDFAWRARHTVAKFGLSPRFKLFATFLSIAILTTFLRCCYRVYELSKGYSSSSVPLRNEPLFIGLESSMVIVAAYALIIAHPGPIFYRGDKGPAGRMNIEAEEKSRRALGASTESE